MNTTNVTVSSTLRNARYIEILSYGLLSAFLIGNLMTMSAPVTPQFSLLVLLGVTLGLMASCAVTPITSLIAKWDTGEFEAVERVIESTASVLPFVRKTSDSDDNPSDKNRRAA